MTDDCFSLSSKSSLFRNQLCYYVSLATQQTEEGAEGTSSTEEASTTATTGTTQGRAITTVTQSTPVPGPSVPVRIPHHSCQNKILF